MIAEYVPDKKKVYIMPHNSNFYTYPNRYTAVLYDDSYKALDQACVQSDMMIMPTEDAHVFASVLAANFQNGPASYYQGKKFSNEILNMPVGKKAVYLGMREDLGSVPEIDKYFTDEYAYNADGVRVQVLKPSDSTQILMITPDNKPWAIRDGNLWIVSAEDAISSSGIKYLEEAGIFEADTGLASEDVYFAKDDQSRAQFLETGTYIFNAEIQNHTGLEQDIDVLLAFYDKEGRLIRLSSERKKLVCGLNTIGFETQAEENDYVLKGFLWGTDMTPLTEEVLLKRQE